MKAFFCALALIGGVTACTPTTTIGSSDTPDPSEVQSTPSARTFDGWAIEVRIPEPRIGPVELTTGPIRAAPNNDAKPWVRHKLIFRNLSDRPLHFDDTRTSEFLRLDGQPRLLVADEGCGYGVASPGAAVEEGACDSYLDAFVVQPHASVTREIILFKALSGMDELAGGSYLFRKEIRFKVGSQGRDYNETIAIRYVIRSASAS